MTSTRQRCPYLLAFAPLSGDGNDFYEGTE
jgi:hypothetical protein